MALRQCSGLKVIAFRVARGACSQRVRIGRQGVDSLATIKNRVRCLVDRHLTLAKVLMVSMLIVEVLSESARGMADLPTGGDGAWPTCHGAAGMGERLELLRVELEPKGLVFLNVQPGEQPGPVTQASPLASPAAIG